MVAGRCASVLVLISATLVACRKPASTADLCFSTLVGMGQNLQTLYCGRDSCYLMVFATNIPRSASVALLGSPVPHDTLALGDAMVQSFLKEKIPPRSHRTAMTFSVERNGLGVPLPRHPGTVDGVSKLKAWVHNRNEEARLRPTLWRDSLILSREEGDSRNVAIRLASESAQVHGLLGSAKSLKLFSTLSTSVREVLKDRLELPEDSLAPLLAGKTLKHRVPATVDSLNAVLKVYTTKDSTRLPHACLEGIFELRSETIGF